MKKFSFAPTIVLGAILITSCSSTKKERKLEKELAQAKEQVEGQTLTTISHESISKLIEEWPEASKAAANSLLTKYGLPQGVTDNMLVWQETGPFKRSIVYKEEVTHNFPMPHTDVLEQFIDYRVPKGKVDDIWKYDGSVMLDRTKGEMSAKCDKEAMNLLALNLADSIIRGKMDIEAARLEFVRSATDFSMGNSTQYTTSLLFTPASETADPDAAIELKTRPGTRPGVQAMEAEDTLESDNME